jgi:hypothetical protein
MLKSNRTTLLATFQRNYTPRHIPTQLHSLPHSNGTTLLATFQRNYAPCHIPTELHPFPHSPLLLAFISIFKFHLHINFHFNLYLNFKFWFLCPYFSSPSPFNYPVFISSTFLLLALVLVQFPNNFPPH